MAPHSRSSWLPLAAILAVAAMVRCEGLGERCYSFDEAFCWKMSTFPVGELAARVAADNHPPLYFYLLWFWSRVFGGSPPALRSLSVLLGLGTVVAGYLLARRVGIAHQEGSGGDPKSEIENPKSTRALLAGETPALLRVPLRASGEGAALAAAALVALSPLQIDWSRQVRMYAAGAFFAVASTYLLPRAIQAPRPRWRDYAWYALAAAALAYTHYFGLFIVAAQFLYAVGAALWCGGERAPTQPRAAVPQADDQCKMQIANCKLQNDAGGSKPDSDEPTSKTQGLRPKTFPVNPKLAAMLAVFFAVGLLWLPWMPVFLAHRRQVSQSFWSSELGWNHVLRVAADTAGLARGGQPRRSSAAWVATAALAVLPLAMLCFGGGGLRLIGLCALVTFDGALCSSLADRNIILPQYFAFAQALLLCGLPPLVTQLAGAVKLPAALIPAVCRREKDAVDHGGPALAGSLVPPYRTNAAFSTTRGVAVGAALAALVGGAAWLCAQHAGRHASTAARPGMMAAMAYLADVRQPGEPIVVANPMVQIAAAGHAARGNAPRVLGAAESFPYYQGTAVMRPDEYLSDADFDALAPRRVWTLDAVNCFAGTWKVELSDDWIDVAEEVFPGPPTPSSRITVRCYERRRQAKRVDGTQ